MADITLYKNYAFSSTYDEVMDCRPLSTGTSPLQNYLSTLNRISFGAAEFFVTMNGRITVQWDGGAYGDSQEYNYMRLQMENIEQQFFAFIREIQIVNDLALITYELDVWNTYSPRMVMRDSLRVATRFPLLDRLYTVPLQPFTNSPPTFFNPGNAGLVRALVVFQAYSLSTEENPTSERFGRTAILQWKTGEGPQQNAGAYEIVAPLSAQLVGNQSVAKIQTPYITSGDAFYEVVEIYLIPEQFDIMPLVSTAAGDFSTITLQIGSTTTNLTLAHLRADFLGATKTLWEMEFDAEPETIGVGCYTNIIDVPFNGRKHRAKVSISPEFYGVSMYLEIDGAIHSWESNYSMPLPYTAAHADVVQQAKISRQIEKSNFIAQQTSGMAGIVGSAWKAGSGIASGDVSSALGGAGGVVGGFANLIAADAAYKLNGSPRKLWTGATKCNSDTRMNAIMGMGYMSCALTDVNSQEVADAIAEDGYDVAYVQKSIDVETLTDAQKAERKYDVVRFGKVRITGAGLSENVKETLRTILTNGCKMWYTSPT